jgi:hypothetical protein
MRMVDTTIRVKDETYTAIIKTRGAFERTFGMKMTLDEAMYLATSYINLAYEEFEILQQDKLVQIVTEKDGSINLKWSSLDKIVTKVLPRLLVAFENFKKMLNAKEMLKTKGQITTAVTGG